MDNLTHAAVGAVLVALVAPPAQRRLALVVGAVAANLPDLDMLAWPFLDDPVTRITSHRGGTHSLFMVPFIALAAWIALLGWRPSCRDARWHWLLALQLALFSHPLLDACTVYGTQLYWPMAQPPVMWGNLFIIDPAFTAPAVIGAWIAWRATEHWRAMRALVTALGLCACYLAWTFVAQAHLTAAVRAELAGRGDTQAQVLVVPGPFNSVLWRIVVNDPGGYADGYYSFLWPSAPITLEQHPRDPVLAAALADNPAVQRLDWFTHGFGMIEADGGNRAVYADLRMGMPGRYVFRYAVATREADGWRPLSPVEQLDWPNATVAEVAEVLRLVVEPPR